MTIHVESTAEVHHTAFIDQGAKIWHHAQVRETHVLEKTS